MKKNRLLSFALVAAMALTLVLGFSASAGADTDLRFMWWGGETRHKATVEAVDAYMANNPGVQIEYEYGGWSGYFDKLLTQLAGRNAPDVVQLSYTNVGEYVVRDQLFALDEYVESGVLNTDKINQTLLDTYKIGGELYAIPAGVNVQFLYYNKDMFDEYGIDYPTSGMTMDEVYQVAADITAAARAKGVEDVWGMQAYLGAFDVNFQRMLIDFGGALWTDDLTQAAFNTPEGIATMEYIKKPYDEGFAVPPEVRAGNPDGVSCFELQQVAMVIDNATSTAGFDAVGDFELGLELAPFGNNKKVTWYQASQVFTITNQSKAPEEAAKLINYLVNDPDAGKTLAFERGIPVNDDIRAASSEGKSEVEQKQLALVNSAAEYMGDGAPMAFPAGYLEIHTEYERLQEAYFYGQKTAEEVLSELESFANMTIGKFLEQ